MGVYTNPLWLKLLGLVVCVAIAGLNIKLLWDHPSIGPTWVLGIAAAMLAFAGWVRWGWRAPAR